MVIVFKVVSSWLFLGSDLLYRVPLVTLEKVPKRFIPGITFLKISLNISFKTMGVFLDAHKH